MSPLMCALACLLHVYCCNTNEQITEIVEPEHKPNSTVIFLHGAGESGSIMRQNIEYYFGSLSQFPSTRFIFPTAMAVPFDPFPWCGTTINIWYNVEGDQIDAIEDAELIDMSAAQIMSWVEDQVESGIPHNRICVAGFSAGGFMSIHFGYEYVKNLGCVGAISAYLPTSSALYKKMTSGRSDFGKGLPPIYLSSGSFDMLIPSRWTEKTAEVFRSAGVPTTNNIHWGRNHFLSKEALDGLFNFIFKHIA